MMIGNYSQEAPLRATASSSNASRNSTFLEEQTVPSRPEECLSSQSTTALRDRDNRNGVLRSTTTNVSDGRILPSPASAIIGVKRNSSRPNHAGTFLNERRPGAVAVQGPDAAWSSSSTIDPGCVEEVCPSPPIIGLDRAVSAYVVEEDRIIDDERPRENVQRDTADQELIKSPSERVCGKNKRWMRVFVILILPLLLIAGVIVGVIMGIRNPITTNNTIPQDGSSTPVPPSPVTSVKPFTSTEELMQAVDRYIINSSEATELAAVYGHPIGDWNVSQIRSFDQVFSAIRNRRLSNFNENVSAWDVSSATSMRQLFAGASSFDQDLSLWDVSLIVDMRSMFEDATTFTGIGENNQSLSSWDVSSVQKMQSMFAGAVSFQGDVSQWDVSRVTDLTKTFSGASTFNGDLSWNVSLVTSMNRLFAGTSQFHGDLSSWDVSRVVDMFFMFDGATVFQANISNWDVSRVTNMAFQFRGAERFNADLSSWQVGSVTSIQGMFKNAGNFNQNLCNWASRLPPVDISVEDMFSLSACPVQDDPSIVLGRRGPFCYNCAE